MIKSWLYCILGMRNKSQLRVRNISTRSFKNKCTDAYSAPSWPQTFFFCLINFCLLCLYLYKREDSGLWKMEQEWGLTCRKVSTGQTSARLPLWGQTLWSVTWTTRPSVLHGLYSYKIHKAHRNHFFSLSFFVQQTAYVGCIDTVFLSAEEKKNQSVPALSQ